MVKKTRTMKIKQWFANLGKNIKWFTTELMKIYSTEDSYFSKKRIESGIAFIIGQFGMIYYLVTHTMDSQDLGIWAGIEFLIAGYTVRQIQKEKKVKTEEPNDSSMDGGPEMLND